MLAAQRGRMTRVLAWGIIPLVAFPLGLNGLRTLLRALRELGTRRILGVSASLLA
jgi:hypothetical protein